MPEMNLLDFTYKELEVITGGFKEELGEGAFGKVYKGVLIRVIFTLHPNVLTYSTAHPILLSMSTAHPFPFIFQLIVTDQSIF